MGDAGRRPLARDLPRLLLLGLLGLLVLAPYIWMVAASLKPLDEIFRASLSLLPERFAAAEKYGLPIHAIGVGEKIDDLRPFDPMEVGRMIAGVDELL